MLCEESIRYSQTLYGVARTFEITSPSMVVFNQWWFASEGSRKTPFMLCTPCVELRIQLQNGISPSSGGVRQKYSGFVTFSKGTFFAKIFMNFFFQNFEKSNFEFSVLRVEQTPTSVKTMIFSEKWHTHKILVRFYIFISTDTTTFSRRKCPKRFMWTRICMFGILQ